MVKFSDRRAKRSLRRKRADMQLIQDGLVPREAAPFSIAPLKDIKIDDFAWPIDAEGCIAGCRVGHPCAVRKHESVARAWTCIVDGQLIPPVAAALHLEFVAITWCILDSHAHTWCSRSKQSKDDAAFSQQFGPPAPLGCRAPVVTWFGHRFAHLCSRTNPKQLLAGVNLDRDAASRRPLPLRQRLAARS